MQTISSKDNPKLKAVRALLRSKKDREEVSAFVMEGVRALSVLADGSGLSCYRLKEIWVSLDSPELADGFDVPVYAVAHDMIKHLSDCRTSQGILGVVKYTPAPPVIRSECGKYLLLDGVMDPGNMGTLIRSAVAFGFDGVFLYGDCVEVFNPKTIRATMGALPFCNVWNLRRFESYGGQESDDSIFQTLEKAGYDLIVTALHGGENLHKMEFGPKTVRSQH